MTVCTVPTATPRRGEPRLTVRRVIGAEWIKAATVRSTYWTIGAAIATVLLFAGGILFVVTLAPASQVPDPAAVLEQNYGPVPSVGVLGYAFMFAYAIVAILGLLVIGPERSTGLLAATLAVAPRRVPVLGAKLVVSAAIGAVTGLVGAIGAFLMVQPQLAPLGLGSTLVDPDVLQVLAGGAVFLALVAVFSTAVASLFRSTAAGMGAVLGLLLVAPVILPLVPGIGAEAAGWLPSSAGMMLFQSAAQAGWQPILTGGLVLLGWTVGAVALGGARFMRRDV
ncbi:ABC transporter permease subunit [Agromyces sp. NPDC056523]|uniref:ABC transporter permease subunit n=1 Tax=Agromyces sp. NPDC056523 TaxID=3345850 RepID=UPI00367093D8